MMHKRIRERKSLSSLSCHDIPIARCARGKVFYFRLDSFYIKVSYARHIFKYYDITRREIILYKAFGPADADKKRDRLLPHLLSSCAHTTRICDPIPNITIKPHNQTTFWYLKHALSRTTRIYS